MKELDAYLDELRNRIFVKAKKLRTELNKLPDRIIINEEDYYQHIIKTINLCEVTPKNSFGKIMDFEIITSSKIKKGSFSLCFDDSNI